MGGTPLKYLEGLPHFAAQFGLGLGLLMAFVVVYAAATPHRELVLVRAGNTAAAISLSGAILGFGIVIAGIVLRGSAWLELAVWGVVALIVQIAVMVVIWWLRPGACQRVADGGIADAVLMAALSVAVGAVNAATLLG